MKTGNEERIDQEKRQKGGLGKTLETLMNKKYEPSSRQDITFRNKDITFITNQQGEPVTLFIGKRKENGQISGIRFSRRIKELKEGIIKESHWDNKGKV